MRSTGKNGRGARKPTRGGGKPNPILSAKKAAEFFVKIAKEYEEAAKGYRRQLYLFAQRCYGVGLQFMDNLNEFHRFMKEEFWVNVRQKPNDDQIMKAVLTFAMNAETPQKRTKATKIARVLDHCAEQSTELNQVASYISENGGIEKLYNELTGDQKRSRSVPDDLEMLKQPFDDAGGDAAEREEDVIEWPEIMDEHDDPNDESNVSPTRAIPKHAPTDKGDTASSETQLGGSDALKITDFGGVASPPKAPNPRSRINLFREIVVDVGDTGVSPEAVLNFKAFQMLAVVGPPDENGWRPVRAVSVKKVLWIHKRRKKPESDELGD